ncbi:hypothetical protein F4824DRAFT_479114 [Ustulina deusta]|nr:hypothetical protein F4824DRAFT_479114 [Ustulina deusta]
MTMATNTASTQYPQLPNEVYLHIVELITDSRYLPRVWLDFRRVSRNFKAITESVFARKHLPHTIIDFPTITDIVYDKDGNKHRPGLGLHFEKLSGDNDERAVFSELREDYHKSTEILLDDSEDNPEDTLCKYVTTLWKECFYEYSLPAPETAFSTPPHILSVRRIVNDTALPGLEVNWERHAISVLWKEMLTSLFAEEEYLKQVEADEFREKGIANEDKFKSLGERARDGDQGALEEFMKSMISQVTDTRNKQRQMVREKRFRRLYNNYTDLVFEEQPNNPGKVRIIHDVQWATGFVDYDNEWGLKDHESLGLEDDDYGEYTGEMEEYDADSDEQE